MNSINIQLHCTFVELAATLDKFGKLAVKLINNKIEFEKNPLGR